MSNTALETLTEIGRQLDMGIPPVVYDGGFVMPRESAISITRGEETKDERSRKRRPETGPGQGPTGWQRPADRQRSTGETPPLLSIYLQKLYQGELSAVQQAYPKTRVWHQPDGMLLLTESALIDGLDRSAHFLVALPYDIQLVVKGWGFWGSLAVGAEWIGPRHTNFPDGSICAFEPSDGTWLKGDPLIELLDLYSVWAVRHHYMTLYRRWPGYQSIHFPYERILELKPDEHCGCSQSEKLYGECCQPKDKQRNTIADAMNFARLTGGERKPPKKVMEFVIKQSHPPEIEALFRPA